MKTSKFYIELKATQLERRDEFSKQVFVEKITNSEYGRFIKLGGEYPKTIEVQTSDIEIEYIPTRKNLYVKLSEPNLKIINDFITLLRDNLTYEDLKLVSHKIHHILDPKKKLSSNNKDVNMFMKQSSPTVLISFDTIYFSSKSV